MKDKVDYLIEIKAGESDDPLNPRRTGRIWGIRKGNNLFATQKDFVLHTENGVDYMFSDEEVSEQLGLNQKPVEK